MKGIRILGMGFIILLAANACFNPPEYPVVPQIEFSSLKFKDVPNPADADSLILTLKFKDGDGDLGLMDSDTTILKYANKYYFRFPDGTFITYLTKRTVSGYDTLPDFKSPFNCTNWDILTLTKGGAQVKDTLYFKLNPNHYNIFVEFQVKGNDGSFTTFDPKTIFIYPNCVVNLFNGRFPVLAKDLGKPSPLEGTIRYSMRSAGFNIFFSIKTLRLKVKVLDRALNVSNEVITPEFTLQSIK